MKTSFEKKAKILLKTELARAGIGYNELVEKLAVIGVEETYAGVSNKISRGKFSFVFFLQCMKALDVDQVQL